jgi:cyclic-di-AMP phosphodiesterase PgpH
MISWQKIRWYLRGTLQHLFIGGIIIFISFLFPTHTRFKYSYEQGQIWNYEDLVAPFDFAIKKPDKVLNAEIKTLMADFSPFYRLNDSIAVRGLRKFDARFTRQLKDLEKGQFGDVRRNPQIYRNFGFQYLQNAYQRGVIELDQSHRTENKNFVIHILEGSTSQEKTLSNLFTSSNAITSISDTLQKSGLADADFLYAILAECISPNIFYDKFNSEQARNEMINGVVKFNGMVRKGELVVPRFGLVSEMVHLKLESLKEHYEREIIQRSSGIYLGYFVLTGLVIGLFAGFLFLFCRPLFENWYELVFLFGWFPLFAYLVYIITRIDALSVYIIPFGIVPILIKTFYDKWMALFTHLMIVLLATFLSSSGFEFAFLQLLIGVVILLTNVDTRDWNQYFFTIFYIFAAYCLGFVGLSLVQQGRFQGIDLTMFNWIFLSTFLTLLANPLIPLLERLFGFTSSMALAELSDLNRPLLQQLALQAPGTLQHSLQVANLAEAAARRIGANHLLVRVAALYHDIGKILQPEYFIENQGGINPHNSLPFRESARIIINHVTQGVELAKQYRLPKILIDFILTHHGTTLVEYFYRKEVAINPETEVSETDFSYPGPKPRTKEESILMLADSIEAAAKATLKNPSPQDIKALIERIIAGKLSHAQLEDSALTFSDLEKCKVVFLQILRSVYHSRIEYPTEK